MIQDDEEDVYLPIPGHLPKINTNTPAWLVFNELFSVNTRYGDLTLVDDRPDEVVLAENHEVTDYITATSGVTVEYIIDDEMNEFRMDILSGRTAMNGTVAEMDAMLDSVVTRMLPISTCADLIMNEGMLVFNKPGDLRRASAILARYLRVLGVNNTVQSIHDVEMKLLEDIEALTKLQELFKKTEFRTMKVNSPDRGFLKRTYKTRRTIVEDEPTVTEEVTKGKTVDELFDSLSGYANPYATGD